MNSKIESVATYIPVNKITNEYIENEIYKSFNKIPFGILEEMTGVKSRYFVSDGEYSSTLAIKASEICFEKSKIKKEEIDLLIFASASQDIIEPATGNIIQKGLGLSCPIFDVKNACNSFLCGLDIADSFIKSGKYKNILICSGETPSKIIKYKVNNKLEFKKYFAAYTFGDAGSAIILTGTKDNNGIKYTYFLSDGEKWDLGTIMGGGSRYPHEDVNYFTGEPGKIRDKFRSIGNEYLKKGLCKLGWDKDDIKKFFVHQVAISNFEHMKDIIGVTEDKFEIILQDYGNIASCCIPFSFDKYCKKNILKKGDKFIFIGLASGFSYGLIFYEV